MVRKVLIVSLVVFLGFLTFQNRDVVTETFFPNETFIAQISLGTKSEGTDKTQKVADVEKKARVQICSVLLSAETESLPYDSVIINEVAWMGTQESFSNEWIELKNIGGEVIDVSGWQLLDKDLQVEIVFSSESFDPGEVVLLKRGWDFTGNLRNSDEKIFLFNDNCRLVDQVVADPDWPAGDNGKKLTMERSSSDLSWYTSSVPGGTPGNENSKKEEKSLLEEDGVVSETNPSKDEVFEESVTGKININTAGLETLQEITGVGPVIAGRIIEYRETNGPFRQIEEIKNVKGIGEVTFLKMRDEISL